MDLVIKVGERLPTIPPGQYLAKVTEIVPTMFLNKRKTLEFRFEIVDGPYRGVRIRGFVNAHYESFTNFSKLGQWILKVLKEELPAGEELNLNIFFDKILVVQVETKISRKTKHSFSNVVDILEVKLEI